MMKNTSSIVDATHKQSHVKFTWDTAEGLALCLLNFGLEHCGSASKKLSCSARNMNLSLQFFNLLGELSFVRVTTVIGSGNSSPTRLSPDAISGLFQTCPGNRG